VFCLSLRYNAKNMPEPPKRRRSRAPRSYAWALRFPPSDPRVLRLSSRAQDGLDYARRLARNAVERRKGAPVGMLPDPLTVEQIAKEEELSPVQIHTWIKQARIELFGKDLSESGIAHRRRREQVLAKREPRTCYEESCDLLLPRHVTARRRFCDLHVASAARVRRYRARAV
jgi:hypothetical protein